MRTHDTKPRLQARIGLRALGILGVLCSGLLLRGDGCFTEDRSVEGVVTIAVRLPWHTQGYTESQDQGTLGEYADEIIDGLGEVSTDEIRAALDAGGEISIAGARGRVTANSGHDAARTVDVVISSAGTKAATLILKMKIPNNQVGTEVSASDEEADLYLRLQADGIDQLTAELGRFLEYYLDGDESAARAVLEGLTWQATWESDPLPSESDPDDFHWEAELIVNVPVLFDVTAPNI